MSQDVIDVEPADERMVFLEVKMSERFSDLERKIEESRKPPQWLLLALGFLFVSFIGVATSVAILMERTSQMPPGDFVALVNARFDAQKERIEELRTILRELERHLIVHDGKFGKLQAPLKDKR
jgi:hypothetical protein